MKQLVFAFLYYSGAVRLAAWWHRKGLRILCYHGVTERTTRSPHDPAGLHVRRKLFETHLDYLQQHYNVISLQAFLKATHEGLSLPPYSVVLTFDDGFRNFFTVAAPQLVARDMPAAVYLITDRMGGNGVAANTSHWQDADDATCLSWAEVRALKADYGIEFGSHSCTHPKLTTLMREDAIRELHQSQAVITRNLDQEAIGFAYPYGDYSDFIVESTRQLGYLCALTTDKGVNEAEPNLFTLRRTLIGDDDDKVAFAVRVSGLLQWLPTWVSPAT
jgi:peptidoglycan/xylan/chitin deacetylase (PgdA/CDA1 family)